MPRENLYLIAIIPPKEVYDQINAFRLDFAERFGSRAALKNMPHITIKTPFKLPATGDQGLLDWFKHLNSGISAFDVELANFGCFKNKEKPVIYVHPLDNPNLLTLQKKIIQSLRSNYPDIQFMAPDFTFKPHMTVAYRDLTPEAFDAAWQEYEGKEYRAGFRVAGVELLQHDTKKWNPIATYALK